MDSLQGTILVIAGLSTIFSACVTSEKLTYLQYEGDLRGDNITDQEVRAYSLKLSEYKLQSKDIISLRVGSITEDEFDFIEKYQLDLGIIRELNQYNQSIGTGGAGNQGGNNLNRIGNLNNNNLGGLALGNQNIGFTLDDKGELELPEIGRVSLAGLTIPEAERNIEEALEGYYETPMVRIQLLNFHFTVLGEIENEGRFTSFDPNINIFDAVALAGNIGELADRSNVKIIRQENGQAKVIYLNLLDEQLLQSRNFYIKRNDIIIVPPLGARTAQQYTLPNVSRAFGIVGGLLGVVALIISLAR